MKHNRTIAIILKLKILELTIPIFALIVCVFLLAVNFRVLKSYAIDRQHLNVI
jgi:hypothetical protein